MNPIAPHTTAQFGISYVQDEMFHTKKYNSKFLCVYCFIKFRSTKSQASLFFCQAKTTDGMLNIKSVIPA